MNSELNACLEDLVLEKINELGQLDMVGAEYSEVLMDLLKLIDASIECDKVDAELTRKDDDRVFEKEKLEIERVKLANEESERKMRHLIEEAQLKHQKKKDVIELVLKGLGTALSCLAFVLSLGFETENSVGGQAARKGIAAAWDGVFKK